MKPIKCSVKYFCFGAFMIFIGSVLLCALGITIVLPYNKTKDYLHVTCHVTSAAYNKTVCSCDQHDSRTDCYNVYPCIQIAVTYEYYALYKTNDDSNDTSIYKLVGDNNQQLLEDLNQHSIKDHKYEGEHNYVDNGLELTEEDNRESMNHTMDTNHQDARGIYTFQEKAILYKSWSDAFYKTCSIHVCDETQWNKKEASRFHHAWGIPGQTYRCYANPKELNMVILNKIEYASSVHAILWPVLCLLCGALVWGGLYVGCAVIETSDKNGYTPHRTNISLL